MGQEGLDMARYNRARAKDELNRFSAIWGLPTDPAERVLNRQQRRALARAERKKALDGQPRD